MGGQVVTCSIHWFFVWALRGRVVSEAAAAVIIGDGQLCYMWYPGHIQYGDSYVSTSSAALIPIAASTL